MLNSPSSPSPDIPLRQIAKLARQYYPSLPPVARGFLDVDDLIQYGAIQWMHQLPRFNPARAKMTTFTHHVIRSYFLEIIRTFKRARHPQDFIVALEDVRPDAISTPAKLETTTRSEDRLERFFTMASPRVRAFFARYYFNGQQDFKTWHKNMTDLRAELDWLIARTGVTADDFRNCRAASLRCG